MPQITLYFNKKKKLRVELAKLLGVEMSKIFMEAVDKELELRVDKEVELSKDSDIKKLIAKEEIEKAERQLEDIKEKWGRNTGNDAPPLKS